VDFLDKNIFVNEFLYGIMRQLEWQDRKMMKDYFGLKSGDDSWSNGNESSEG